MAQCFGCNYLYPKKQNRKIGFFSFRLLMQTRPKGQKDRWVVKMNNMVWGKRKEHRLFFPEISHPIFNTTILPRFILKWFEPKIFYPLTKKTLNISPAFFYFLLFPPASLTPSIYSKPDLSTCPQLIRLPQNKDSTSLITICGRIIPIDK